MFSDALTLIGNLMGLTLNNRLPCHCMNGMKRKKIYNIDTILC